MAHFPSNSTQSCLDSPQALIDRDHLPSISVVTCSSFAANDVAAQAVATSLKGVANVQVIILSSVAGTESYHRVVEVPEGTKLSKLRQFSHTVDSDFVCICDPDLDVHSDATRDVVRLAIEASTGRNEVVAFGVVGCRDDGTLLSSVIAIDKWLSHRVLRPMLWRYGLGITIPGQFLVLSTSVLRRLNSEVDSYLDDLYLGWIARSTNARVLRVPVVVGKEESRSAWASLLTQRLRWMRGWFSLVGHLSGSPKAIGFLAVHFVAYHGLPVLWLVCIGTIAMFYPVAAVAFYAAAVLTLSRLTHQSIIGAVTFLLLFPLLHCFATLLWWAPIGRQRLRQR